MLNKKFRSYPYYSLITTVLFLSFIVYFSSYSFGIYRFFSVQSASMEPTLKVGDLILIKKQTEYQLGSIITVSRDSNKTLTHRLVDIQKEEFLKVSTSSAVTIYRTQGDNNITIDSELFANEDIVGHMILKLPLLGTLVDFLKTDFGLGLFIIVPGSFIIYKELDSIKKEVKKIGKIRFK